MMRVALAALLMLPGAGPQDSAQIAGLIRKLDASDWVEQAQAAKELVKIGRPALNPLAGILRTESESGRYWASMISQTILRSSGPAMPAAPAEPEPPSSPNPAGFAPGENDVGSVMFICNNQVHDDYEAVLSRCLTCGKMKRFAYDYNQKAFRCTVCKKVYNDVKCDKCGQPPGPRTRIRMKRH